MQDTLVSIITPVYNGEKYIAQTIESVLAQTYPDWEMLIIDDGSRDNSAAIARDYCARDSRISLYSQTNAGSAAARNNGIRRARGRYIALLDADDLWDSTFLASQLNFMKEKGALLVCSAHRRIDEYGRECLKPFFPPEKATYTDLLRTCSISCLTGLYDTSAYGKVFLNEKFKSLRDDLVYWLEIVKKTGAVVYLKLSFAEIESRLGDLKKRGVALKEGQTLRELYEERVPLYEKYADLTVECGGKSIRAIVEELSRRLTCAEGREAENCK